jgi:hypothetical protein
MPAPRPPEADDAAAAIERALLDAELQAAIKRANEAAEKAEEAAKAAAEQPPARDPKSPAPKPRPKARPLSILPGDPDYISCADARRGVTMSCFTLRLNAHVYEGYSEKKKAMANACLTSAERVRIAACFQ